MPTEVDRLVLAANTRAFEAWLASEALAVRVPYCAFASATTARVLGDREPTVIVIVGLRAWAWCWLGLAHALGWVLLRARLGTAVHGYRIKLWVV